jgi:hypothetical protein
MFIELKLVQKTISIKHITEDLLSLSYVIISIIDVLNALCTSEILSVLNVSFIEMSI